MNETHAKLFHDLAGYYSKGGMPIFGAYPIKDSAGSTPPYFVQAGVAMMKHDLVDMDSAYDFLDGMEAGDYLADDYLPDGTRLAKFAGQLCYLSLGEGRTKNPAASRYFDNIKKQAHGSILGHVNYTFLIYGVDRAFTHELVRHCAGTQPSQVSTRYVDKVRYVERPEYQTDPAAHQRFLWRIENNAREYAVEAEALHNRLVKEDWYVTLARTEQRKIVRQVARSVLNHEVEAPILFTVNGRSIRHIAEQRASKHADRQIREVALRMFLCASMVDPILFEDYSIVRLPDGTAEISTPYRKV
jgi:thymidylate synthase (FAD)